MVASGPPDEAAAAAVETSAAATAAKTGTAEATVIGAAEAAEASGVLDATPQKTADVGARALLPCWCHFVLRETLRLNVKAIESVDAVRVTLMLHFKAKA
jgi:hypothetical protein